MILIKIILTALVVLLVVVSVAHFRSRIFVTLLIALLGLAAILLVMMPDLSSDIAHMVGVGRGADLLMYLGFIGLTYLLVLLYAKLRATEARLTEVIRSVSINQALLQVPAVDTEFQSSEAEVTQCLL